MKARTSVVLAISFLTAASAFAERPTTLVPNATGVAQPLTQDPAAMANAPASGTLATTASPKVMNPDISPNGLFSWSQFNSGDPVTFEGGHDPHQNGFNLQQVELSLGAAVDPYFRADANLVLINEKGENKIEIEEAYGTTLGLPWNLQVKAGQFFTAFGRHNPTHPHAWNFANKPLVLGRMFGGDGLRNPGAQLSWITPLPWYSELIGSVQNSTGGTAVSFINPTPADTIRMRSASDLLKLVRWANFVSLSESLSMNLGASYAQGPNGVSAAVGQGTTQIGGLDLYLKFRRPETQSFLSLQFEILKRYYSTAAQGNFNDWGWYTELNYRLEAPLERWHVGARFDWVSDRATPVDTSSGADRDVSSRYRVSPVITFYPSEFSKLRLQYDFDRPAYLAAAQQAIHLQFEFNIGVHGAHVF